MSQYPPPGGPPGNPPGLPPGYPPGYQSGYPPGYPPNVPPPGYGPQGYSLPAITRTSGAAIASLICGLMLCIPVITGLSAVITGIIGIGETSKPGVNGRGMAIAGLILGIIGLAGWGLVGVGGYAMWQSSKPLLAFAKTYIIDLDAGKIDQCLQNSTGDISRELLQAQHDQMKNWGPIQDTTIVGFTMQAENGTFTGSASGFCKFSAGPHKFQMNLAKDSTGQYKVQSFSWQN